MRVANEMRADGFPESEIEKAGQLMKLKFRWARTGENWSAYEDAIRRARDKAWFEYIGGPITKDGPGSRLLQ